MAFKKIAKKWLRARILALLAALGTAWGVPRAFKIGSRRPQETPGAPQERPKSGPRGEYQEQKRSSCSVVLLGWPPGGLQEASRRPPGRAKIGLKCGTVVDFWVFRPFRGGPRKGRKIHHFRAILKAILKPFGGPFWGSFGPLLGLKCFKTRARCSEEANFKKNRQKDKAA